MCMCVCVCVCVCVCMCVCVCVCVCTYSLPQLSSVCRVMAKAKLVNISQIKMHRINNFKTTILDVSENRALKVIFGTTKEE